MCLLLAVVLAVGVFGYMMMLPSSFSHTRLNGQRIATKKGVPTVQPLVHSLPESTEIPVMDTDALPAPSAVATLPTVPLRVMADDSSSAMQSSATVSMRASRILLRSPSESCLKENTDDEGNCDWRFARRRQGTRVGQQD